MEKNILIIGSGSVIGRELITKLILGNNRIWSVSRNDNIIESEKIHHRKMNILEEDIPSDYLPDKIDGLVYLPGNINLKPFKMLKEKDFLDDININFIGAVKSIKSVLKKFNHGSSVVMFSSVAVQKGMKYHTSLGAAKGAVEGFARSLAAELAPAVRVNVVAPSLTNTPLGEKFINTPDKLKSMKDKHPLHAIGEPGDIAAMVHYLLSDDARWMSGQIMHIDGGLSTLDK